VQQIFFVNGSLHTYILNTGWSHEQIQWAFVALGFTMSAIHAAGIFLLVLAALVGREREE